MRTICMIDDDDLHNKISTMFLNKLLPDVKVETFTYPEDAIENLKAAGAVYDLILLDINMPIMNGWEFMESCKENNFDIPIFLLTSSIDNSDKLKAKEYSMVRQFHSKPINNEIIESIKIFLENKD
jgi:CheY-like chemotaxis protein